MNHLLPILKTAVGQTEINTVNARDLHEFLEVGKDFSNWIKSRIDAYNFEEGKDFIKISNDSASPKKANGGSSGIRQWTRGRIDYHLSLDMAKELSMVERNEKGRQARKYFIECEKKLSESQKPVKGSRALLAMIQQLVDLEDAQEAQEANLRALEEKVDRNLGGTGFFTIVAYGKMSGTRVPSSVANMLGKRAASISRQRGIIIGKAPDEKWGEVGAYRKDILEEVFENYLANG